MQAFPRPWRCLKPIKHPAHCIPINLLHHAIATRRTRCMCLAFTLLLTCGSAHQVHSADIADSLPNYTKVALALLHHPRARPSAWITLPSHGTTSVGQMCHYYSAMYLMLWTCTGTQKHHTTSSEHVGDSGSSTCSPAHMVLHRWHVVVLLLSTPHNAALSAELWANRGASSIQDCCCTTSDLLYGIYC